MRAKKFPVDTVLKILKKESKKWDAPVVALQAARGAKPFLILISALLSAQTRDSVTSIVTTRLFKQLASPRAFLKVSVRELEKLIYPVSFYKTKARHIHALCRILIEHHSGVVPADLDMLLTLPGVGRKTANLVIAEAFGQHGICVDTHVHRITNRWGYVQTKTPLQTEMALRSKLPRSWWKRINPILVAFGQTLCQPVSPWCSKCPVRNYCPRIGVKRHR